MSNNQSLTTFTRLLPNIFGITQNGRFTTRIHRIRKFTTGHLVSTIRLTRNRHKTRRSNNRIKMFSFKTRTRRHMISSLTVIRHRLKRFIFKRPSCIIAILRTHNLNLTSRHPMRSKCRKRSTVKPNQTSGNMRLFRMSQIRIYNQFRNHMNELFRQPIKTRIATKRHPTTRRQLASTLSRKRPRAKVNQIHNITKVNNAITNVTFQTRYRGRR